MLRGTKLLVFIPFFIAIVWALGLLLFLGIMPSSAVNDTRKTDAIIVLTGGSLRLDHGFDLLIDERADRLFISGVEDDVTFQSIMHNKEYLQYNGKISAKRVELGHKARSTLGNALEAAEWIKKNNIRSIRLVTANYHMPRSYYEIKRQSPAVLIIPEPVFPGHFANNQWLENGDAIRLVLSEYHKYMIAHFRTLLQ